MFIRELGVRNPPAWAPSEGPSLNPFKRLPGLALRIIDSLEGLIPIIGHLLLVK